MCGRCSFSYAYRAVLHANKVFLSVAGVDKGMGITSANECEVSTKQQAIIRSFQEKILLVGSGEFDAVCSSYFCELLKIDTIVTDDQLSAQRQMYIRDVSIRLNTVWAILFLLYVNGKPFCGPPV